MTDQTTVQTELTPEAEEALANWRLGIMDPDDLSRGQLDSIIDAFPEINGALCSEMIMVGGADLANRTIGQIMEACEAEGGIDPQRKWAVNRLFSRLYERIEQNYTDARLDDHWMVASHALFLYLTDSEGASEMAHVALRVNELSPLAVAVLVSVAQDEDGDEEDQNTRPV